MSFVDVLKRAKQEKKIVAVYVDDSDWGVCSVGFVDVITEEHVRLRSMSRHGEFAGYEVRELCEIFKIEVDGKYEKKIGLLHTNQGKVFSEMKLDAEIKKSLILDMLEASKKEKIIIVVWGDDPDDSLVGYVKNIAKKTATLCLINEYGEEDGVATISLNQIKSLDFNTHSEQVRKFLWSTKS